MSHLHSNIRHLDFSRRAANERTSGGGATECAERPPAGYRLVVESLYCIGPRDMIFVGGRNSSWRSARRAGEAGSFRRDSAAQAVAVLVA